MKRRCPLLVALAVALAILSACARPTPTPASLPTPGQPATATPSPASGATPDQPSTDWPMFRYSLDRAGYNPHETAVRPPLELKWEFQAKSKI